MGESGNGSKIGHSTRNLPIKGQIEKEGEEKMSRTTKAKLAWTLTVLRNGLQGPVGDLEEAEFRFGRSGEELVKTPLRRLSAGISSLIRATGIVEEALETGFTVEMRVSPGIGREWRVFSMLAGNESWRPEWKAPRSVYANSELDGAVEFSDLGSPCSFYNQLPRRVWIRVVPLTMPIIAWAMTNGIYSCPKGDQSTLHQWCDLSDLAPRKGAKELVLPGPPQESYNFFSGL